MKHQLKTLRTKYKSVKRDYARVTKIATESRKEQKDIRAKLESVRKALRAYPDSDLVSYAQAVTAEIKRLQTAMAKIERLARE
jgi:outer membrane protein assembly factor BamD (BamD/ComL family)